MINFKKMDDKDFVFVNKPLTDKEEKKFSEFLKSRKAKTRRLAPAGRCTLPTR